MKIFINAYTLRVAGGLSVGLNFFQYLFDYNTEDEIIALVPPGCGYEKFTKENMTINTVPPKLLNPLFKFYTHQFYLPALEKKIKPDVVYSMGNIAMKTSTPQLLLFHLPHACYDEKPYWGTFEWKFGLYARTLLRSVRKNLKYANRVICQTQTMRKRLAERYNISLDNIGIVPNAVSLNASSTVEEKIYIDKQAGRFDFVTLSKYYPHKNLESLLEVAEKVKMEGLPYRFFITVAPEHGTGAPELLEEIKKRKLEEIIVNLGPIPHHHVPQLYAQSDGLFFPTLLESFTGTYVEAMFFKKPIFTSDLDFAREICKEVAFYFDPLSAESIVQSLHQITETEKVSEKVKKGTQLVTEYPGWDKVGAQMITELKKVWM